MNDITDLHVHYLQHQLAAQQAVGQQLYKQGYSEGLRHSTLEIPQEFVAALRHGSAHEHVHVPLLDGYVTVVLASTGTGDADERREAAAWEELENVRLDIRERVLGGVRFVQRRQLPASIAAVIWRRDDRLAVVTNKAATCRPRLRAALRAPLPAWVVALFICLGIVRRAGRAFAHMATPSATVAAVSAAAVTVIATTPATSSLPAEVERGGTVQAQSRSGPLGPPLAFVRPPRVPEPEPETGPEPAAAQTEVPAVEVPVIPPEAPAPPAPPADPAPIPTPTAPTPSQESTPPRTEPAPADPPSTTATEDGDPSGTDPAVDPPIVEPFPRGCMPVAVGDGCPQAG